jgi:predicted GNAT family acetyltransferase
MPEAAALTLARALHERGEQVEGINGALPAAEPCAEETARLSGRGAHIAKHTRLFEVTTLRPPPPVPGDLRRVTRDDVELATEWMAAFVADADEQAGRSPGASFHEVPDEDGMLRRIDGGRLWFWEDAGAPVHLIGVNAPSLGVARIGPVYTPKDQRGRGYASAAVAEASRRVLAGGARACLFTDQANPTSNALYRRLGYEPVTDMAELVIR